MAFSIRNIMMINGNYGVKLALRRLFLLFVLYLSASLTAPTGARGNSRDPKNGAWQEASQKSEQSQKPNVVLIVIDTLRYDHLPFYGYKKMTAPFLSELASKGVIFSLLMQRAGHPMEMAIDINPAKQGKYLPATGLLVRSPEEAFRRLPSGATIYVMNSNYLDEIQKVSKNAYRYVGVDRE